MTPCKILATISFSLISSAIFAFTIFCGPTANVARGFVIAKSGPVNIDNLVRGLPSLACLSGPQWRSALDTATVVQVRDGGNFALEIDRRDQFTLILQGTLTVRLGAKDGRSNGLFDVHSGELCVLGHACLRDGKVMITDVIADGDVIALSIPVAQFDALIAHSPEFREIFFTAMTLIFSRLLDVIQETALQHSDR